MYVFVIYICCSSIQSFTVMDDLDSLFEADLASINEVFQEFEIKDKKDLKRQKTEEEELKKRESRVRREEGGM